jgi:cation diffusion facilitator CzcD-associated flavoprotein CzcO
MRPLLPEGFDVEKHFTPRYRPWQQRIAIAPDGDLFATLHEGTVSIVTDTIEEFTEKGIRHVPASRLITITARRRSSFPVVWRTPAENKLTDLRKYPVLPPSGTDGARLWSSPGTGRTWPETPDR